jgi:hypothetical protein
MDAEPAGMEVEWLILADAAQVTGGKLFLLGGGWDVLAVNTPFPLQQRCAVAAAFRVPWNETNQRHMIEIEIEDQDSQQKLFAVAGEVEVGRPPGIPPGENQRVQLAADLALAIEKPGTYRVIAKIAGEVKKYTTFRVVPGPMLAMQQGRQGNAA